MYSFIGFSQSASDSDFSFREMCKIIEHRSSSMNKVFLDAHSPFFLGQLMPAILNIL